MSKTVSFKGSILLHDSKSAHKNISLKYKNPSLLDGFEESLTDTMMSSFDSLNLSPEEKKNLSRSHRRMLNCYRHLNPFTLNHDSRKLINEINQSNQSSMVIEANQYGVYVCLAALYSGKIASDKKIEFILEHAPLALFPSTFIKSQPKSSHLKITFRLTDDSWLVPFKSLYNNQKIKYSLKKAA